MTAGLQERGVEAFQGVNGNMTRVSITKHLRTRGSTIFNGIRNAFSNDKNIKPSGKEFASTRQDFLRAELQNGIVTNPNDIMTMVAPGKLGHHSELQADIYALHKVMRQSDLKYKSLIQTRKNGVLSKNWRIEPNGYDTNPERALEIADFITACLEGITNFHKDIEDLLDAIPIGYAVSEIIWEERVLNYGDKARMAWVVKELKQRRPGRFGFDEDDKLMYAVEADKFVPVPEGKFIVHSHAQEHESPYGVGEAGEVFWAWFLKHNIVKWWAIFGERFGMPTAIAKYPQAWKDDKVRKLADALRKIQTETGIVIPSTAQIEFLEAQRYGTVNVYQSFVDWCDKSMSEGLTGQSLATGQGENGSGSYAQAETHAEVKQEYVESDCKELMATLNSQLIPFLVEVNFGDAPCPTMLFEYETENLAAELELDIKLLNDIGLPMTKNYFYDKYKRSMPGDGEEIAPGRTVSTGIGGGFYDAGANRDYQRDNGDGRDTGDNRDNKDARRKHVYSVSKSDKKDVKKRREVLDGLVGNVKTDGFAAYDGLKKKLEAAIESAADMTDLNNKVMALDLTGFEGELATALAKGKINGYLLGAAQIKADADKVLADDGQFRKKQFAIKALEDYEPLDPEEALKWFEGLTPFTTADLENLGREATNKAIVISGTESRKVVSGVQELILDHLKSGETVKSFLDIFKRFWSGLGLAPKKDHQVEQMFRTETARAYGAGRTVALRDADVVDAFPLWQYVSIVDDRTRPEHAALNGFVASPEDPFWLTHTPPWDFNCRCDVIPLTKRQIETRGISETGTVVVDGAEVDPRGWASSPTFRGVGL